MNLSRTTQPTVGAGAGVCFGSGLVDRGGVVGGAVSGGGGGARWTRRCSPMRSPPRDMITQLAECLLRRADRYRPREFGRHESDGSPDEKEGRPKHEPPGYQACMMRGEMWPRRQERFPRPDASPPRCAQLMGLALRGCLVLVLGATAERRKLLFRSDLGLPWIRTLSLPRLSGKAQVKQQ